MSKVKPVPDGYHNATPYMIVDGAARALDFYKRVFAATERMRIPGPGGKIGHAEISIGDSIIMLADEHPEMGARGPSFSPCRTSSMATGPAPSRTRSGTSGTSGRTRKTYRRTSYGAAPRPRSRPADRVYE